MMNESALAPVADPEVTIETTEEVPSEVAQPEATPEQAEQISAAKARRERERAARQRQAEELEQTRAKLAEAEAKVRRVVEEQAKDARPTPDKFPDPIEYTAELAAWNAMRSLSQRERQAADQEVKAAEERARRVAEEHRATIDQNWVGQVSEARTRYSDFDATVAKAGVGMPEHVAMLIKTADQGADLAYHLGQNPELARQISQLHPVEAARMLGRLEATLSAPKPRTFTNAPDPVNPVRGNATAQKDPTTMTAKEFAEWRAAGGTFD